jgi:hypothetical protein
MRRRYPAAIKGLTVLFPVMFAGACATPAKHFGDAGIVPPAGDARSFTVSEAGEAAAAVRQAMRDAGFEEREDARFRVEVGFAVRPRDLELVSAGRPAQAGPPADDRAISFCRKQAYVLTLALVERESGAVASRSGAAMSRCRGTPAELLPRLAQSALPFGRGDYSAAAK